MGDLWESWPPHCRAPYKNKLKQINWILIYTTLVHFYSFLYDKLVYKENDEVAKKLIMADSRILSQLPKKGKGMLGAHSEMGEPNFSLSAPNGYAMRLGEEWKDLSSEREGSLRSQK